MSIIDISEKKEIFRFARAKGIIKLRKESIERIKNKEIEKGDVFQVAEISGILAVKKTPELIPYCHNINISNVHLKFGIDENENKIHVICEVKAISKTGVEMEALIGCSTALLTIWDMCKKYEKDENGQYPHTKIENIEVLEKIKIE